MTASPRPNTLPTEFAPAERAMPEILAHDVETFRSDLANHMLDAVPDIFVVLNDHRQIVYANDAMRAILPTNDQGKPIYGLRPGEALGCVHAFESEGGCGTTQFCRECGAVKAILTGINGKVDVEECRISLQDGGALDLRVRATPLEHDDKSYVMFAVQDIGHEKRRRMLERIFFHDVLNTAGIVYSAVSMINHQLVTFDEVGSEVDFASRRLVDEIKSQQLLAAAENDELQLELQPVNPYTVLETVARTSRYYDFAQGIHLIIDADDTGQAITTDPTLLTRVLANMVKNALEASDPGDAVTLSYDCQADSLTFSVNNPAYMPLKVQLQVFQRSFSTKGKGRGLGTYSIKLLSERFLGGRVWFETDPGTGTTFKASFPLEHTI